MLKQTARAALRCTGGLHALRFMNRRRFAIPMFHGFSDATRGNLEALCDHMARHFEPVTLTAILNSADGSTKLPDNAISVTIDDGYRNFLLHGHPIFRRHRIPTTIYAVSGFADRRLWLWTDKIAFAVRHTALRELKTHLHGGPSIALRFTSEREKADATHRLIETLKTIPDQRRREFVSTVNSRFQVELPESPPRESEALSWEELRALADEQVEIGCHTETHPILSRVEDPADLEREIRGAKLEMEERLGFPVHHFCYPNGKPEDITAPAVRCVRDAGYRSAVTCTWGMERPGFSHFEIRRIPLDSTIQPQYAAEWLAGARR